MGLGEVANPSGIDDDSGKVGSKKRCEQAAL
jgi:hypothetical protein